MIRPTEGYVLGESGSVVVIPGRVASKLERVADLNRLRIGCRGTDPEFDNVLAALHLVALDWRRTATGTDEPPPAELPARSTWINTRTAADLLGLTDRAIRKAIAEQRLPATRIGPGWRIAREDLEHFRAARTAA